MERMCQSLLAEFTERSREILGDNLTGIYLHGSLAMGCFCWQESDIDLLVAVKNPFPDAQKRRYMDMVTELNGRGPAKGIELSVIRESVCRPPVYPTPYELHFSIAHLDWYRRDPGDYIRKMKGTDKDLAAHIMILYYRGKTIFGKPCREVFLPPSDGEYFDSIWCDVQNAAEEITGNPVYLILNLCRVLAYKKEHLILSKEEGASWALDRLPAGYRTLISQAAEAYRTGASMDVGESCAVEFAEYMLREIRKL